ncbi:hypothetical protein MBANPS3_007186 [Mucor bainieri]
MSNNSSPTGQRDAYFALDSETETDQQQQQQQQQQHEPDLLSQTLGSMRQQESDASSREQVRNTHRKALPPRHGLFNQPRQFYRASYKLFAQLRQQLESNHSQLSPDAVVQVRNVLATLAQFVDMTRNYTEATKYTRLWELCQRLYFPTESTHVLCAVRDWLNSDDPLPDVDDARAQDEDEDLEEHNSIGPTWIWEHARRHLLRGNFDESANVLTFALDFVDGAHKVAIASIIHLVAELDGIVGDCQHDATLFYEKWAVWSKRCRAEAESYERALSNLADRVAISEEIWTLYRILAGDDSVIAMEGTYFEVVLGTAWFAKPQVSLSALKSTAQRVQNTSNDDPCSFLLMGRFDDAFGEMGGDLWLHTHLGYALIITGHMEASQGAATAIDKEEIIDPIYYSIQAYAQMIVDECDMLEEAIHYLDCCQSNREIWVTQLLGDPILPAKDVDRVQGLLNVAAQCGMSQVEQYIHRGLGRRFEKQHNIRQATVEYGKAQDLQSLDKLAHAAFSTYLRSGTLGDVVTDMASLHNSPHYAILIQYHNFHHHLSHQEWQAASQAVLLMLKNQHLPPKFETVLLIDVLQILRESKHYFSAKHVIQLIHIYKQVAQDAANQDFIAKYYKMIEKQELTPNLITAKIRERLAYKAATAPTTVC